MQTKRAEIKRKCGKNVIYAVICLGIVSMHQNNATRLEKAVIGNYYITEILYPLLWMRNQSMTYVSLKHDDFGTRGARGRR